MSKDTCWTLVEEAANGKSGARDAFARLYLPVVEAYLGARWAGSPLRSVVDDGVQDVFLDLVKPNGALTRARRDHGDGGFRAFLYGVALLVARRHEERARRRKEVRLDSGVARPTSDETPSRAFEAAWARAIMRSARERHAQQDGAETARNVELLRLRFQDGVPIRTIAVRWHVDAARLHRQFRRARREFAEALFATVAEHHAGTPADVKRECARLLDLLV